MANWSFDDIPDQTGRTAIVTGANSGIGFETARMLARKGAEVIIACRNPDKGTAALARIREDAPGAKVSLAALDLADLDSVTSFAEDFAAQHDRLDLLIANAGVMVPPSSRTKQGFELQIGTNHLGHFALTARLLPLLERTAGARIVVVASSAAHMGRIDFDDLSSERKRYRAWSAYSQSKLANLLFMLELGRRLDAAGSQVRVTGAHPGWTATELQRTAGMARWFNPLFAMKPSEGALPTLRAAVDPTAEQGGYYGPSGMFEMRGPPVAARFPKLARDEAAAARLWSLSESLTGVPFELQRPGPARAAS
ncbi:MAG: SDR family oxidoreductase [Deltaproteobacteria bacterium]|nr:SDR family oxidoreductase [Nannocystaceae bacterium]